MGGYYGVMMAISLRGGMAIVFGGRCMNSYFFLILAITV